MIGSRTSDNSVAFRPTDNQKWPQSLEIISRWSKNRYYGTPTFLLARGKVEISPRASQGVRLMSKRYATSRACDVICLWTSTGIQDPPAVNMIPATTIGCILHALPSESGPSRTRRFRTQPLARSSLHDPALPGTITDKITRMTTINHFVPVNTFSRVLLHFCGRVSRIPRGIKRMGCWEADAQRVSIQLLLPFSTSPCVLCLLSLSVLRPSVSTLSPQFTSPIILRFTSRLPPTRSHPCPNLGSLPPSRTLATRIWRSSSPELCWITSTLLDLSPSPKMRKRSSSPVLRFVFTLYSLPRLPGLLCCQ